LDDFTFQSDAQASEAAMSVRVLTCTFFAGWHQAGTAHPDVPGVGYYQLLRADHPVLAGYRKRAGLLPPSHQRKVFCYGWSNINPLFSRCPFFG
jgi:hypothetical protein